MVTTDVYLLSGHLAMIFLFRMYLLVYLFILLFVCHPKSANPISKQNHSFFYVKSLWDQRLLTFFSLLRVLLLSLSYCVIFYPTFSMRVELCISVKVVTIWTKTMIVFVLFLFRLLEQIKRLKLRLNIIWTSYLTTNYFTRKLMVQSILHFVYSLMTKLLTFLLSLFSCKHYYKLVDCFVLAIKKSKVIYLKIKTFLFLFLSE